MNRLKEIREEYNLLSKNISEYLNISQSTYNYYETGKKKIPISILIKLAKYYNTSTDYILGLTNERKPYPKSIIDE